MLTSKHQEFLIWFNNSQQQSTEVLEGAGRGGQLIEIFLGFHCFDLPL